MKTFKFSFILILFTLISVMSCQDEVTEITQPNNEETIIAGSSLAVAMQNTASRDGSIDNILYEANCLSIELPVTVIVNGIEITIDSEEDYNVIEAIFNEFDDDDDVVEIQFPITIILSDYSQINIDSYAQLEEFAQECFGENEDDDDIECIDFVYPFTISVYNADFQVIDTVTIETDAQLFSFIGNLQGGVLASINFPVNLLLADGTTIEVNNNNELITAINNADGSCDEDDDYDYGDDNNNDIPVPDFVHLLTDCIWTVDVLEIDDVDLENQYINYVFTFNANGTVQVTSGGATVSGTWELLTAVGIHISLNIPDLPDFNNNNWILHEIEEHDEEFKLDFRNLEDRLRFERLECGINAQCSQEEVNQYLQECIWQVVSFNSSNDLISFTLNFNSNQELVVTNAGEIVNGSWSTSQSTNGEVNILIDGIALPNIQVINGSWAVINCQSDRLELQMDANNMVLEQSCNTNSPFDCFGNIAIVKCDDAVIDGSTTFDLETEILGAVTCTATYFPSFHESLIDAESNINALPVASAYVNSTNPQTLYLRIEDNEGNFQIFEIGLTVQDCSTSGSVEDLEAIIVEGTWIVASYIDSGDNDTSIYANYSLTFDANGSVVASDGGANIFNGTWNAFLNSNDDLKLILDFGSQSPFNEFNDDWLVIDLQTNRIELYDLSGGDGTEDFLVFERI